MVDKKTVEYVANLARINITKQEADSLHAQLSKIIGYIDKLKEVDVKEVRPMRGPDTKKNVFREDKAVPSNLEEDILKNSPQRSGQYFKIPKVIE